MKLINISELKENKQFSQMVPEMTEVEYKDFLKSIEKDGVRQPIHILLDKTILDGRHRVRACKDLGIEEIQALVHNLDKDEAVAFVRDTAIERRNITVEQRVDIVLRSEELISELEKEAKSRMGGDKKSEEYKKSPGSREPNGKRTNEAIADMAGTSKTSVVRMKKIKREAPDIYEEVIQNKKAIGTAYNELPSVQKNKGTGSLGRPKGEREVLQEEPKYKIEELTEEEAKSKIAYDNLVLNFNQLNHYVASNQEKLYEAICKKYKDDEEFMDQSEKTMKNILELMKVYKEENKK